MISNNLSSDLNGQDDANQQKEQQEERKRKIRELEREVIMQEDEHKKKIGERTSLEAEIRQLKKDMDRARVEMQNRQEIMKKINFEISQLEEQIKATKKKMNTV